MALPDEPNVTLPLATSVTERGVSGFTHSVTNSEDQRKVNFIFEPVKNPMNGKGSLDLVKRPGVTIDSGTYGVSSQLSLLTQEIAAPSVGVPIARLVFSVRNTSLAIWDVYASVNGTGDVLILSSANRAIPAFVDLTAVTNAQNVVLQVRRFNSANSHQVFFITSASAVAAGAWTEIVDADFTVLKHTGKMEHLDGYAFILANNNVIWNSDVGSLANWSATSFLAKSIQQDVAVGLARLGNKILAFSSKSVEVFYNAGNTVGSPLGRITNLSTNIGLVQTVEFASTIAAAGGTHYYATLDNSIYFVGRDGGSTASVGFYSFDGSSFQRLSTVFIDKILSEKAGSSIYSVNTVGISGQSAIAVCLTSPSDATQRSLVYFPLWREWFEWTSSIFSPVNGNGFHLGVAQQHKLFTFAGTDIWQDNGVSYLSSTQFKLPSKGSARNVLNMYGVDADTSRSANDLLVEISRDDCQTFETLGTIDLTQDRKVLFRGGAFRNAHIRLGNTNAVETRIHSFLARING